MSHIVKQNIVRESVPTIGCPKVAFEGSVWIAPDPLPGAIKVVSVEDFNKRAHGDNRLSDNMSCERPIYQKRWNSLKSRRLLRLAYDD